MRGAAGTTGAAGSMAGVDPYAAARQACVDKINMFRATLGLAALTRWTAEEACTDGEAKSDSESGTAHGAFSACTELAQDECPGWPSVDAIAGGTKSCLDQMWAEGPGTPYEAHGHYINMSNPKYTTVACGYYTTPDGKIWAAQDLR
jgi:cysteine-rich secretory family protein